MVLLVGVGDTVTLFASAIDGDGRLIPAASVTWSVADPTVASVDGTGHVTAMRAGATEVRATWEGVTGEASVEVYVPPEVEVYRPGTSYLGRKGYVEYIPGRLPVVISAPHGGDLAPEEIPDRSYGTLTTDRNTREVLLAVREAFLEGTGYAPHVIISHLQRRKLDPNREIEEAAQGNVFAEQAWREFQGFIDTAEAAVADSFSTGLYMDLHGHGHTIQRVELGYLLSAADLNQNDETLNAATYRDESSIRRLAVTSALPFSQLLRGPKSLGGYLVQVGVRVIPGPTEPSPGENAYFSGGYNTARHGSRDGGLLDGIQVELNYDGIRDSEENRRAFAEVFADAVERFVRAHHGFWFPFGGGGA